MSRKDYTRMSAPSVEENKIESSITVNSEGEPMKKSEESEQLVQPVVNDSVEPHKQRLFRVKDVYLNVRERPTSDATVLTVLAPLQVVSSIESPEDGRPWRSVTLPDGTDGFCLSEYLVLVK